MESKLEIIITDDHKIFRVGLEAILSGFENIEVIGDAENGKELFELLRKTEPDIIFMDVNLVEESGIDLTRKVLAKYPDIIVIALTSSDEVNNFNDMLEAGASAFMLKGASEQEIKRAIDTVVAGDYYFSKEFMFLAKNFYKQPKKTSKIVLSDREKEVLSLICQGHSNQEIADAIDLSVHTVDSHRRNLLNKTSARNTASLVMIALRDGLIEVTDN
ncbi:MAG TPA: DNA-binding response regulator [Bacteroidales bacterium]|jgi:DNA-binding NarL/FixJ family response regulator|nr:DNA-binding response regulator [Bacteroidales bacterium]